VVRTRVGYTGGDKANPSYERLGDHTEAVQVDYDPRHISYDDLLDVFWSAHDPRRRITFRQYRNAVFVHDEDQRRRAEASLDTLEAANGFKVQTEILDATRFYVAEDYHQKYNLRRSGGRWLSMLERAYPEPAELRDSTAAARLNGYLGGYGEPTPQQLQDELGIGSDEAAALAQRPR
jgi:peptide-methionine (S)-S-oxide reductase